MHTPTKPVISPCKLIDRQLKTDRHDGTTHSRLQLLFIYQTILNDCIEDIRMIRY